MYLVLNQYMKTCKVCGDSKTSSEFYDHPSRRPDTTCKECRKKLRRSRDKELARKNPTFVYEKTLKTKYGITPEDYETLLKNQNGGCAICGAIKGSNGTKYTKLQVDHDHSTGRVRGLVCIRCNGILGKSKERIPILQ